MNLTKIGILTFHYSHNYGAIMQSIYLFNFLKSLGYNVEIINYLPRHNFIKSLLGSIDLNKNTLYNLSLSKFYNIIIKLFIFLSNFIPISLKFYLFKKKFAKYSHRLNTKSFENYINKYSHIIVGSDQIWNPYQRLNKVYFLNYNFKGIRISYAADSTNDKINSSSKVFLSNALKKFDFISVRNDHTKRFVNKLIVTKPSIVLDPTLLTSFENNLNLKHNFKEKYVLFYILGDADKDFKNQIKELKIIFKGLLFYSIKIPTAKYHKSTIFDKEFFNLGPTEWLSMIKNSEFFITDSFHGVLFSLKLKVLFSAYYSDHLRASRLFDLKTRFHLNDYIYSSSEKLVRSLYLKKVPFDIENCLYFKNYLSDSIEFINKSLLI